jgi:CRP-like cAMP-binding protein
VFKQGDVGDKFYVISAGSVDVQVFEDGKHKKSITLGVGDFFGEVALLTGASRNATVVCKEPAELLSLDKDNFKDAVSRMKSLDEQLRDALYQRQ